MKTTAKHIIPASLLPYCQIAWRKRYNFLRSIDRRTLSREELTSHLRKLGFTRGATIFLHSSMDEFSRRVPSISPFQLIGLLKEMIGEEGTLLMPTFATLGKQYYYVQNQRTFDVKRTPSRVGFLTELFRRGKGVTRSLHPTHSVAAWGKHSKELVAEHHLGTAFGEKSPIYRMQQYNGLVAAIGKKPKRCFTLYHMAEELHPITHAMQYGDDKFDMTIINGEEEFTYQIITLRPDRKRRYVCADNILQKEKILHYYTVKGLKLGVAPVHQFLKRSKELIDANTFYGE